jgi:hypothetical protein
MASRRPAKLIAKKRPRRIDEISPAITTRSKVTFRVKEYADGKPWITIELLQGDLEIEEQLGFDFWGSPTYEQATKIADYLNRHVRSLSALTFKVSKNLRQETKDRYIRFSVEGHMQEQKKLNPEREPLRKIAVHDVAEFWGLSKKAIWGALRRQKALQGRQKQ